MRLFVIAVAALALSACEDPALKACDDAIKETLKAPASYHRISAVGGNGLWAMQYDAVNSFNAPIRRRGQCSYAGGSAFWAPGERED